MNISCMYDDTSSIMLISAQSVSPLINEVSSRGSAAEVRLAGTDKFYTIPVVVDACIASLTKLYDWEEWELVVEPSAGSGNFLSRIPTSRKIGMDIFPEGPDIIQQDFFEYSPPPPTYSTQDRKIVVIGNPPFGKASSLAVKFFNHAACWADTIAFVVPRTFRRASIQNRLNRAFTLQSDEDVPVIPCSFVPKMGVKCCFQIWTRSSNERSRIEGAKSHADWTFLPFGPLDAGGQPTPPEGADFALRAYGGKCGEIRDSGLSELRPKSWHWIKCASEVSIETLVRRFGELDYAESRDTARQNSLGRGVLVGLYAKSFTVSYTPPRASAE